MRTASTPSAVVSDAPRFRIGRCQKGEKPTNQSPSSAALLSIDEQRVLRNGIAALNKDSASACRQPPHPRCGARKNHSLLRTDPQNWAAMQANGDASAVVEAAARLLPIDRFNRVCSTTGEKQPIPAEIIMNFIRRRVNNLARSAGNGSGKAVRHGSKRPTEHSALCGGRDNAALLTPHAAVSMDPAGEEEEPAEEKEPAEEEAEAAVRGASTCRSLAHQSTSDLHTQFSPSAAEPRRRRRRRCWPVRSGT